MIANNPTECEIEELIETQHPWKGVVSYSQSNDIWSIMFNFGHRTLRRALTNESTLRDGLFNMEKVPEILCCEERLKDQRIFCLEKQIKKDIYIYIRYIYIYI